MREGSDQFLEKFKRQTVQRERGSAQAHCTVVLTLNLTPVPTRDRRVYEPQSKREHMLRQQTIAK